MATTKKSVIFFFVQVIELHMLEVLEIGHDFRRMSNFNANAIFFHFTAIETNRFFFAINLLIKLN